VLLRATKSAEEKTLFSSEKGTARGLIRRLVTSLEIFLLLHSLLFHHLNHHHWQNRSYQN